MNIKKRTWKERGFSIMGERTGTWFKPIPWRIIAAHERQALRNHGGQSLETLHARGGLSSKEALHVLKDLTWYNNEESQRINRLTVDEADRELRNLVTAQFKALLEAERRGQPRLACTHAERPPSVDSRGMEKCPQCGGMVIAGGGN